MKTKLALFLLPALVFAAGPGAGGGRNATPRLAAPPAPADCPANAVTPATPSTLPAAELIAGIEEERLAHDLYIMASQRWGLRVFTRIAAAETRHESALLKLAASSAVAVPSAQTGIYASEEMQRLYGTLAPLINESATSALMAAALLEETDIVDLRTARTLAKDEPTQTVLTHLERASGHHLRAFVRNLEAAGVTYAPKVLSAVDYQTILAVEDERGFGRGPGRDAGRGNGRGAGLGNGCGNAGNCDGTGPGR